jgi:hypothetical protein
MSNNKNRCVFLVNEYDYNNGEKIAFTCVNNYFKCIKEDYINIHCVECKDRYTIEQMQNKINTDEVINKGIEL